MTEKFLLVSLEGEKAKKIAEVLSNNTARKILDYLSNIEEASESQIARDLKLKMSTVHYNLNILKENKLIESKEFQYSEKGREMDLFKVAKKLIIIAPKEFSNMREKLKAIIPSIAILALGGVLIQMVLSRNVEFIEKQVLVGSPSQAAMVTSVSQELPNYGLWFFLGALSAIIIYLLISWRLKK